MDIENKLRSLNKDLAIQGELIGEGIQDNKLKIRGQTIRFFNAFDIGRFEYLPFQQFIDTMEQLQLPTVPIVSTDYELENEVDAIIRMATIKSKVRPEVWAEGVVIRPLSEKLDLLLSNENFNNGRVSFKAINPEFLLKYGG